MKIGSKRTCVKSNITNHVVGAIVAAIYHALCNYDA